MKCVSCKPFPAVLKWYHLQWGSMHCNIIIYERRGRIPLTFLTKSSWTSPGGSGRTLLFLHPITSPQAAAQPTRRATSSPASSPQHWTQASGGGQHLMAAPRAVRSLKRAADTHTHQNRVASHLSHREVSAHRPPLRAAVFRVKGLMIVRLDLVHVYNCILSSKLKPTFIYLLVHLVAYTTWWWRWWIQQLGGASRDDETN